jgi:hypothetical protein
MAINPPVYKYFRDKLPHGLTSVYSRLFDFTPDFSLDV